MPNFRSAEGALTPKVSEATFSGDVQPSPAGEPSQFGPAGVSSVSQTTMTYSGPVPSFVEMAGYARIDPTYPDRILTMAENNAEAERKGALRGQIFEFVSDMCGRVLGAGFAMIAIGIAAYLALHGHDTAASVIGGATVVAVAAALITGRTNAS